MHVGDAHIAAGQCAYDLRVCRYIYICVCVCVCVCECVHLGDFWRGEDNCIDVC